MATRDQLNLQPLPLPGSPFPGGWWWGYKSQPSHLALVFPVSSPILKLPTWGPASYQSITSRQKIVFTPEILRVLGNRGEDQIYISQYPTTTPHVAPRQGVCLPRWSCSGPGVIKSLEPRLCWHCCLPRCSWPSAAESTLTHERPVGLPQQQASLKCRPAGCLPEPRCW